MFLKVLEYSIHTPQALRLQDGDVDRLEQKVACSLHDDWTTTNDNVKTDIYTEANTIRHMVFIHDMIVCAINSLLTPYNWATVAWLLHDVLADD